MAGNQNKLIKIAKRRALESKEKGGDLIGHYPVFWMACFCVGANLNMTKADIKAGKAWEMIRDVAEESYSRSLSIRKRDKLLADIREVIRLMKSRDPAKRAAGLKKGNACSKRAYDRYAKEAYCQIMKVDLDNHDWTAEEIALTTPVSDGNLRKADFQKQVDREIEYLDFDV